MLDEKSQIYIKLYIFSANLYLNDKFVLYDFLLNEILLIFLNFILNTCFGVNSL